MPDSTQWDASAEADGGQPPQALVGLYRAGTGLLVASVAGMTREDLLARPIEGKMSSLEVVCHIADAEQFLADRMKRTVATDQPPLVGVNGILYLDALSYAERDLELQLDVVEATREQMAADLERLDATAWERTAVHTETGLVTLRQLLIHAIRHLEGHVLTIAEKRQALGV